MSTFRKEDFIEMFNERFEAVVLPHFEEIYAHFAIIHKKLEEHDQRFEQIDQRFEQIDQRFEEVESSLDSINRKLNAVVGRQDDHGLRIKNLENKAFRNN